MNHYAYISTRADYDPCKTLLVFGPSERVSTVADAEAFAQTSGWQLLAEYDGAVLIVPVMAQGYAAAQESLPAELLGSLRNAFSSRNGRSLHQRGGKLWTWETMAYLAGYGDGADFAGSCLVSEPARFAGAALIGGAPQSYAAGARVSSHPFLRSVSEGYCRKNAEIPVAVWFYGASEAQKREALAGFPEGSRLRFFPMPERFDLDLAAGIMTGLFDRVIRWKDGPDGTLTEHPGRTDFYLGSDFIQHSVSIGTVDYPVAVHLPRGKAADAVRGLPLLFSVHGRGEPAWLFATKNGWDSLADETGAFVLALPDSPGNLWQLERDEEAIPAMIDLLCETYGLDRSRVYLTGFSNGAMMTRELASVRPELFAGISPWNGPVGLAGALAHPEFMPELREKGLALPAWICVGDRDPAAAAESVKVQLGILLPLNGCKACEDESAIGYAPDERRTGESWYTPERGYAQGGRFDTAVYHGPDGKALVCCTVMQDMPHGAIKEQSRAAWSFLRQFRRDAETGEIIRTEDTEC